MRKKRQVPSRAQKSGSDLEHAFQRVLNSFFREAGYEIVQNRVQTAGTQFGCDLQWTVRPPAQAEAIRLLFECKNYSTPVPLKEIVDKPFQTEIGGDRVDGWILVSPHVGIANDAEVAWNSLVKKIDFPLLRLTPEQDVDSLIALDSEAHRMIYGREPEPFDRAAVLERWSGWFARHLSSANYLQRFSSLFEVVDVGDLRKRFARQGALLQDLALAFYRGARPGWEEIVNNVDVRRQKPEERIARAFEAGSSGVHLVLVHCEGGSGKSTFLRRVALETVERGGLVMFSAGLPHNADATKLQEEIIQVSRRRQGRRMMIIIDNGAAVLEQLTLLAQSLRDESANITLVVAERLARWRDAEDSLKAQGMSQISSAAQERLVLSALRKAELADLVALLKRFQVSDRVQQLSEEELEKNFREQFRGDLLVTLHEVISGQKFDDIVRGEEEEFRKQHPSFPFVYAFTAALHQFGISMPESLLGRLAGVSVGDLTSELQLKHVLARAVETRLFVRSISGWTTRHEIVAKSVFRGQGRDVGRATLLGTIARADPHILEEVTAVTQLVSPLTRREIWGLGYAREIYEAARKVISHPDLDLCFLQYCLSRGDFAGAEAALASLPAGFPSAKLALQIAKAEEKRGRHGESRRLYREALGWMGDATDANSDAKRLRTSAHSTDALLLAGYLLFEYRRNPHSSYAAHLAEVAWGAGLQDARLVELRANIAGRQGRPADAARYRLEGEGQFPASIPVFRLEKAKLEKNSASRASIFQQTIDQGHADAAIFLAYALLEKGRDRVEEARKIFEQGILVLPKEASLYQAYALLEKEQKEYEKARELFERGIEADPTSGYLYQAYALLEKEEKDYEKARELFERGIEADPMNGPLFQAYALLENEQKEYEKARELFERGIEADATDGQLYCAYALLEKEQKEYEKARELFNRGIEADPTSEYLYAGLAKMEISLGHWRRASEILAQGERYVGGSSAVLLQYRGRVLSQLERFEDARGYLEQGLRVDPKEAHLFQELAHLYARWGEVDKVEAVLRDGCQKCPDNRLLSPMLAKLLITVGRNEEAGSWVQQSLSNPRDVIEQERMRTYIFGGPLRLGRPDQYRFVKRDVQGVVSRLNRGTEKAYGFVKDTQGVSYYFSLHPKHKPDFTEGSRVWFDVVEFSGRETNRLNAKFVEIMLEENDGCS
ncbi:MAG TPA: tetratricopeptide repeat protein [Candidatus Angelobacter sp.]|jgi:tetratricopeptide (TPR) repeat protein